MIEQNYDFACPYCGTDNSVSLDMTGGSKQSFPNPKGLLCRGLCKSCIQDCTVCCKPIHISLQFENGELADFSAEQQD